MASEPLHSSAESAPDLNVGAVLEHMAACVPFNMERTKGQWSKSLSRAATTANLVGLSALPFFATFAVLRHHLGSVAGLLDGLLLLIGLLVLPIAGLTSLLCILVGDALHFVGMHKRRGRHWASEYEHDALSVSSLLRFSLGELRAADTWFEQKIKRMERRQARFFGGNDKVALLTLVAAGWAAWKEVQGLVLGSEPSWLLFGLAFLAGLTFGGLMVSQELEKMAYLRDLLAVAIKRREAAAEVPNPQNAK